MKNSAARIAANNKWVRANYERISVTVPKGMKKEIQEKAASMGKTLNRFSRDAICEAMKKQAL